MKDRDVVIILFVLLVLLAALRAAWMSPQERVRSRFTPGAPGSKPPYKGEIGDVVEWGGRTWGWTEWKPGEGDWVLIESLRPV
jgi:hypothetical protein